MNHEQKAQEHRDEARASFERCDTDGFLSQWAHGINARLHDRLAQIERDGGVAEFPALFDLEGNRVRAKLIDGRWGQCWAICDDQGDFTGEFVSAFPKRASTMERKGYREGVEIARASARISAPEGARGLSGASQCYVETYRLDRGYPE